MTAADCSLEHVFDIEVLFGADRQDLLRVAQEVHRQLAPG